MSRGKKVVQTTFAGSGSPWAGLGGAQESKPQPAKAPAAKAPSRSKASEDHVRIADLSIVDDTIPETYVRPTGSKYASLFAKIKVGQAVRCKPTDVQKVSAAMRKWIVRLGNSGTQTSMSVTHLPGDKTPMCGRVWLVARKDHQA